MKDCACAGYSRCLVCNESGSCSSEITSPQTFSELYNNLITEAKKKYSDSEIIKRYDTSFNMAHLSVSEVFEELDMLDSEREENFKWSDNMSNVITDESLGHITEGFEKYIEIIKDEEI